jgi:S1-C subfamily serine protease
MPVLATAYTDESQGSLSSNGLAAEAGLAAGDVLLPVNGQPANDAG